MLRFLYLSCRPAVAFVLLLSLTTLARADVPFLRGDTNGDGRVSIADVGTFGCILLCDFWFPPCEDAVDANDDGVIDITDLVTILVEVFTTENTIAPPFPDIGPDPTPDSLTCQSYTGTPARVTDETLRLGCTEALAGELASLPLYLSNSLPVGGIQLVVSYPAGLFTPIPTTNDEQRALYFRESVFDSSTPVVGTGSRYISLRDSSSAGEGVFRLGFLPALLINDRIIPVGETTHVLTIPGIVSPDAVPGTVIELTFTTQEDDDSGPARNEIMDFTDARLPSNLIAGSITVVAPRRFIRGDSNLDGKTDVSDAIHMLRFMFLGGAILTCRDAADVNDDGVNDLGDSIGLLAHLFLGGLPPSAPWPTCGTDPSTDILECEGYPGCGI